MEKRLRAVDKIRFARDIRAKFRRVSQLDSATPKIDFHKLLRRLGEKKSLRPNVIDFLERMREI